jgi:hypothetical protein
MGVNEDDFATYQQRPEGTVTLDFLPNEYDISAEVVAWRPYDLSQGDIAALKLLKSAPERSKPIPILRCSCEEIQHEEHSVYGFAKASGDRSDAYKPKANAVGGRFQFHKKDDPQDATIEAGFSGAPVWNDERKCVIGMVATARESKAEEKRHEAYAIPEEQLSPILQEIFAYSLYDLIEQGLKEADSKVRNAIEMAFWLCEEGRVERNRLLGRLQYLTELSNRGWQQDGRDVDRLIQFAVFLAIMDGLPRTLRQGLEDWVSFRRFEFDPLYKQANQERQDRQVPSAYAPEHLVVQIKSDEQDKANVKVWLWVIGDRDLYDPLEPPQPRVKDEIVAFADLPQRLEEWLEDEADPENVMVHCFVARHLLGCDLDACETEGGYTLGGQCKLAMRTDLSQSPPVMKLERYRTRWERKWSALESKRHSPIRHTAVRYDCEKMEPLSVEQRSAGIAVLENLAQERVEEVFALIAKRTGWPVVLWARQNELCQDLDRLLDHAIFELPHQVYRERDEALRRDEQCLGSHLSLVWEDFKVFPPTMMMPLDQESC